MVTQIQGYDISGMALLQPRDRINIDLQGWSVTRVWLAAFANWETTVGAAALDPHPLYATCLLESIDCAQELEFGELCLVVLKYGQRYSNVPTTNTPPPQYGINGTKIILPITLHPNFNNAAGTDAAWDANAPWKQFWDATKKDWQSDSSGAYLATVPSYLIGYTQFPDAGATIWTKTYYRNEPTDPLPENKIVDPGFGFGPSGAYRVDTCDQQKENAFWCRTLHFEYYPNGVPQQIFQLG